MASSSLSVSSQSQRSPAASMVSRVDRLDLLVGYLEDMRGGNGNGNGNGSSNRSSSTTTTLSSSPPGTPRIRSRTAAELLQETKAKGSLVDRIAFLENRVLKMEEDRMTMARSSPESEKTMSPRSSSSSKSKSKRSKKGLKSIVESCVRGKLNTKD